MKKISKSVLNEVITPRNPQSYKGNYGRVLIIAGSAHFGGAAILATSAAVASGAGLVTIASVPEKFSALNNHIPEAMTLDYHNKNELLKAVHQNDVIAIGPGLELTNVTRALIKLVLKETDQDQTIIIDASALTMIAENKIPLQTKAHIVMTPHQGEWQRLSGLEISEQTPDNNLQHLNELNHNAVLIVKKHFSEIYYQDQQFQIQAGNPGMATGGMGDTLTGIVAGFIGQFGYSLETVAAALLIHSYIADKLNEKNYVVLPSELIKKLPKYMAKFSQSSDK